MSGHDVFQRLMEIYFKKTTTIAILIINNSSTANLWIAHFKWNKQGTSQSLKTYLCSTFF